MAVLAMKRITICGLKADSKPILERIQRAGVKYHPYQFSGKKVELNL